MNYINNITGDTTGVPCCNPFSTIIYPIGPNQSNATTIGLNQTVRLPASACLQHTGLWKPSLAGTWHAAASLAQDWLGQRRGRLGAHRAERETFLK